MSRLNEGTSADGPQCGVQKSAGERPCAAPHTVVGVHIFGDDACELVHFGTTLVQAQKTLAEVLQVCYAAVTYHELFKLAARDAIATLQKDAWRRLYRRLDEAGNNNGTLEPADFSAWVANYNAGCN